MRGGYTEDCQGKTWEIAEGDVVLHEAGEAHAEVTVMNGNGGNGHARRKRPAKAGPMQAALAKLREASEPAPVEN